MANGYIGKISAVVTANTSDLSRKLQGSVGEVDKFANRIASSIARSSAAAQDSLNKIFTPLQRLQRNIQAGLAGNVFKRDNVDQYIRGIQQAVSISEQLGKPLASGAAAFAKLSLEVQGAFLPALNRAQDAVTNLSSTLQQQGSVSARSFGQVEAVVERTTQAIQRLAQAQQLASQSLTGNELQFGNPRLFEALNAGARLTQRAGSLPAAALASGDIARQVQSLQQYQNAAVEAEAVVARVRLDPTVNPDEILAAERRLVSLIETAIRAQRQLETSIGNTINGFTTATVRPQSSGLGLFGTQAGTAEQRALQKARELDSVFRELPSAAQTGLAGLARIAADLANRVEQGTANAQQLEQVLERLQSRIEAATAGSAAGGALIVRDPNLPGPGTALGDRLQQAGADRIRRGIGDINIDSTPRGDGSFNSQAQRDIDALAAKVGVVRAELETLPNAVRARFVPALQQARDELTRLQNSPAATVGEIERARQAVDRLAKSASTASASLNFREQFGAGAGGFDRIFQDQALKGYTAQLQVLQDAIGRTAQYARGPALAAFARLRDVIAKAFRDGTLESEATQAEIRALTAEAVKAASAVSGISAGAIGQKLQRAGDIGRAGFDKFGLAVQQAAFAIDDFFSVTGGLDQRIRAVGNNLTQLAFILGGTAGLFGTVLFVAATQAAVGLIKFLRGGAEGAEIAKGLNARLEEQARLLKDAGTGFADLAGNLAEGAFTESEKKAKAFEDRLKSLTKTLEDYRQATLRTLDPELVLLEGQRNTAQRRLEAADSLPVAIARRARVQELNRGVADVERGGRRGAGLTEADVNAEFQGRASLFSRRDLIKLIERRQADAGSTFDSVQATVGDFFTAGNFSDPFRDQLLRLEELRNFIESGIADESRRLQDSVVAPSTRRIEGLINTSAGRLDGAGELGGNRAVIAREQAALASLGTRFRSLIEDFGKAVQSQDIEGAARIAEQIRGLESLAEARERESRSVLSAAQAANDLANAVSNFGNRLDETLGRLNSAIADEVSSLAEQARREANRAAGLAESGLGGRSAAQDAAARRDRLAGEAAAAEERRVSAAQDIERARAEFVEAAGDEVRQLQVRLERNRRQLEDAGTAQADRLRLRQENVRLESEIDQRLAGQLQQFADSPTGRALQARFDEADRQAQAVIERDSLIARGNELAKTPAQQAAEEFTSGIRAINAAFDEQARIATEKDPFAPLADIERKRAEAIGRFREDALRQAAPGIFNLADQVQNAVQQGQSRAALEANDVSTVEGARELSRLLRGDDAARNQDLVQLQREANRLLQLIADAQAGVAN